MRWSRISWSPRSRSSRARDLNAASLLRIVPPGAEGRRRVASIAASVRGTLRERGRARIPDGRPRLRRPMRGASIIAAGPAARRCFGRSPIGASGLSCGAGCVAPPPAPVLAAGGGAQGSRPGEQVRPAAVAVPGPFNGPGAMSPAKPASGAARNVCVGIGRRGSAAGNGAGWPPVRFASSGHIGRIRMPGLRHPACVSLPGRLAAPEIAGGGPSFTQTSTNPMASSPWMFGGQGQLPDVSAAVCFFRAKRPKRCGFGRSRRMRASPGVPIADRALRDRPRLTRQARLDLVHGVAAGWTQAEAARRFHVSRATAAKRLRRYREEGRGGLRDRCSRPHRSPCLTPPPVAAGVLRLRRDRGAWDLAWRPPPPTPSSVGPGSTVATGCTG